MLDILARTDVPLELFGPDTVRELCAGKCVSVISSLL